MNIYFQVFRFVKIYQPYSVYFLIAIFLLTSILEAIGISFVMPVIALVLEEDFMQILKGSDFGNYVPNIIFSLDRDTALLMFSIFVILYLSLSVENI